MLYIWRFDRRWLEHRAKDSFSPNKLHHRPFGFAVIESRHILVSMWHGIQSKALIIIYHHYLVVFFPLLAASQSVCSVHGDLIVIYRLFFWHMGSRLDVDSLFLPLRDCFFRRPASCSKCVRIEVLDLWNRVYTRCALLFCADVIYLSRSVPFCGRCVRSDRYWK